MKIHCEVTCSERSVAVPSSYSDIPDIGGSQDIAVRRQVTNRQSTRDLRSSAFLCLSSVPMLRDPSLGRPQVRCDVLAAFLTGDVLRSAHLSSVTSSDVLADLAVIPARQVSADPQISQDPERSVRRVLADPSQRDRCADPAELRPHRQVSRHS